MVIRTIFEQKIKISFLKKLTSKEKATFLWFDLFLLSNYNKLYNYYLKENLKGIPKI